MTDVPEPIITIGDIRKTGHCVAGARTWFEAHNLDFKAFLKDGLPAGELLAAGGEDGDGLAQQVVTRTLERRNG